MNFELDRDQRLLQRSARSFFEGALPLERARQLEGTGHDPALWAQLAELGWIGLCLPEDLGGQGMGWADMGLFLEEAGRACLGGPFLGTAVLAAPYLHQAGGPRELVEAAATGRTILALALAEADGSTDPDAVRAAATPDDGGWQLSGSKLFVPDADAADVLLVVARTPEGLTTFLVDRARVHPEPMRTLAGEPWYRVALDGVWTERVLGEVGSCRAALERALDRAALGRSCMLVGALGRVLELTLERARTRRQFDRPIGSFQAIQHLCADMAVDVDGARLTTRRAAWALDQGQDPGLDLAIARAWAAEAAERVAVLAHRVHGAAGFTTDLDLHMYTRRVARWAGEFRTAGDSYEAVARSIGL